MVKAEALINLTVAFEAEVQVHVALEDEDGADAAPIVAFLGENITVRFDFLFSLSSIDYPNQFHFAVVK